MIFIRFYSKKQRIYLCFAIPTIWFFLIALISSVKKVDSPQLEGESITFLLGEDKTDQSFYRLAEEYFSSDTLEKTDHMITHIRSLEQLIHHLNNEKPIRAYDRVEIVVHGNVWSGLSVAIMDGGGRAYPKELLRAVLKKELPKLKSGIINGDTRINIWGCGIGTNPLLNIALDSIFKDEKGKSPSVNPSKDFVVFKRINPGETPKKIRSSYWPYFFKRGYRPSESEIELALRKQYPEVKMDWRNALKHKSQDDTESFQDEFNVHVSWTRIYPNKGARPDVGDFKEKITWIRAQRGLMKQIEEMQIPIEKYNWTVNKIIHTDEHGNKVPAIKAIGMSTVLCVMELKS